MPVSEISAAATTLARAPQPEIRTAWWRALNFSERIRLNQLPLDRRARERRALEAEHRFAWWAQELKYSRSDFVYRREVEFGVDEETTAELVGASADDLSSASRTVPGWLQQLGRIFGNIRQIEDGELNRLLGGYGLLSPAWPWIAWAIKQLEARTASFAASVTADLLIPSLRDRLHSALMRTFALELNVARVSGRLTADTPEKRFTEFSAQFSEQRVLHTFFDEYPVLARVLTELSSHWLEMSVEFLTRLDRDWPLLWEKYLGSRPGRITGVRVGAGDRHRCGRSVIIIEFEGAPVLLYKPRSLECDQLFEALVTSLSGNGDALDLRPARVEPRGDYGWMEFLSRIACEDNQLNRFYERAGQLLAIVFCLYGTDLHHENLIAHGEFPVLVDLECLFSQLTSGASDSLLDCAWTETLLSTHLLPGGRVGGIHGPEMSGFVGPSNGALTPPILRWERGQADDARITRSRVPLENLPRNHAPTKDGDSTQQYVPDIIRGFRNGCASVMEHRDEVLQSDAWAKLASHAMRHVAWQTIRYDRLLQESYHPNLLRDAMDREACFDALFMRNMDPQRIRAFVSSERCDLWRGDIPMFHLSPESGALWDADGQELGLRLPCGKAQAESRIRELNREQVDRHAWTIQTAFDAAYPPRGLRLLLREGQWKPEWNGGEFGKEGLLNLVRQIADRLLALAFRHEGQIFWVDTADMSENAERRHCALPSGINLYSGLGGFLWFFHYAARTLREQKYEEAAEAIARTMSPWIERNVRPGQGGLGGFGGITSCLYVLTHRLAANGCKGTRHRCERLLDGLADAIAVDKVVDIVGGASGTLCTLLGYHAVTGDRLALDLAIGMWRFAGRLRVGTTFRTWLENAEQFQTTERLCTRDCGYSVRTQPIVSRHGFGEVSTARDGGTCVRSFHVQRRV